MMHFIIVHYDARQAVFVCSLIHNLEKQILTGLIFQHLKNGRT